jgi:hypothetical protein
VRGRTRRQAGAQPLRLCGAKAGKVVPCAAPLSVAQAARAGRRLLVRARLLLPPHACHQVVHVGKVLVLQDTPNTNNRSVAAVSAS